MRTILMFIHIATSLALISLVLLQHGRGADAGAAFGSGASQTLFGARGSSSFLTRATAILATIFFSTSLTLAYLGGHAQQRRSVTELMAPVSTSPAAIPEKDESTDLPVSPALTPPPAKGAEPPPLDAPESLSIPVESNPVETLQSPKPSPTETPSKAPEPPKTEAPPIPTTESVVLPVEVIPAKESVETILAKEPVEAIPAKEPVEAIPAKEPVEAIPAKEPIEAILAKEPIPAKGPALSEPAPTEIPSKVPEAIEVDPPSTQPMLPTPTPENILTPQDPVSTKESESFPDSSTE